MTADVRRSTAPTESGAPTTDSIYASAAHVYLLKGWLPLPLPSRKKYPPPAGWTGHDAPNPSYADVQAWIDSRPAVANIAIRMPAGVIGIDCDGYAGKHGPATVAQCEIRWGALPPTFSSTSRGQGSDSRIRFYRVPAGALLLDVVPGGDVEVIQRHHRYAVAEPSVHPEGGIYAWFGPDGQPSDIPAVSSLPELPGRWVDGLRSDRVRTVIDPDAAPVLLLDGTPGPWVQTFIGTYTREVTAADAGSRHDYTRDAILRFIGWCDDHAAAGGSTGLAVMKSAYVGAVGDVRDGADEFDRMVAGAMAIVASSRATVPTYEREKDWGDYVDAVREIDTQKTAQPFEAPIEPVSMLPSDWSFVDLSDDDDDDGPVPTMLVREDGQPLIYPGQRHCLFGQPGSGKSFVALILAAEQIKLGHDVLYIDYESNHRTIKSRLRSLGCTAAERKRFHYIQSPSTPIPESLYRNGNESWTLVVIDGVTVFMGTYGMSGDSNDDAAKVIGGPLKRIADTGAAVVDVDHLPKNTAGASRGPLGAMSKHGQHEVTIRVELDTHQPIRRGKVGYTHLFVTKDRPGHVEAAGTDALHPEVAYIEIDATDAEFYGVRVHSPADLATLVDEDRQWAMKLVELNAARTITVEDGRKLLRGAGIKANNERLNAAVKLFRTHAEGEIR